MHGNSLRKLPANKQDKPVSLKIRCLVGEKQLFTGTQIDCPRFHFPPVQRQGDAQPRPETQPEARRNKPELRTISVLQYQPAERLVDGQLRPQSELVTPDWQNKVAALAVSQVFTSGQGKRNSPGRPENDTPTQFMVVKVVVKRERAYLTLRKDSPFAVQRVTHVQNVPGARVLRPQVQATPEQDEDDIYGPIHDATKIHPHCNAN